MSQRPLVALACTVLNDLLGSRLPQSMPVEWMDISLHNTPKKMAAALQERLDALATPSTVLIGYGLCGNGLVGLKSGPHTLVIPRTHDCVAIFLGSHQRYVQRFFANPNTYYLTKGWIDAKDEPLTDYRDYVTQFDEETADYLVEMKYKHYRKLCLVGFSQEEIESVRPAAMEIARFCHERFGMVYEETIGTTELIDALVAIPADVAQAPSEAFLVLAPGSEVTAEMFHWTGDAPPQPIARKENS